MTAASSRPRTGRALFADLVRSEWTKLCSLRSTWWTLLIAAALGIVLGALFMPGYPNAVATEKHIPPAQYSLSSFFVAQLAIVVLGVLAITGEYATGSIRATFAAAPQRRAVLAAKAVVLAPVTAVVGTLSAFGAFFVGQASLADPSIAAHITDPGVVRSIFGVPLYLTVLSLLSLALATLIRRTVPAIAAVVGLVFILSGIADALPTSWYDAIAEYLPCFAGEAVIGPNRFTPDHLLPPWVGFGVFCAYTAVALAAATVMITRFDT